MTISAIISIILAIISLVYAFYSNREMKKVKNKLVRYDWNDIERAIHHLALKKKYRDFNTDAIICISGPGSIVANLFLTQTNTYLPIFLCISEKKDNDNSFFKNNICNSYDVFSTRDWTTYIPKDVMCYKDKKIMIIDDTVNTGETINALCDYLISKYSYNKNNIMKVSVFASRLAIKQKRGPDLFFYEVNENEFYLPWGSNTFSND
jgi:hypoxanthine phosphoribosyltransferase